MCFGNINLNLEVGKFSTKADFRLSFGFVSYILYIFHISFYLNKTRGSQDKLGWLQCSSFTELCGLP